MSKTKIIESEYDKIVEIYLSGVSKEQLQKMYNVSSSVITRILKLKNVKLRDHSHKKRKYELDENYFDKIDTQNKAYILGLLYADGCNYTKTNTIKIELQERDKTILEKMKQELKSTHQLRFNELSKNNPNWQNTFNLTIVNKHMSHQLEKLGMIPRKSLVLEFPTWLDEKLIPHFILGYFDGNGHIECNKSYFVTIASTENFCKYIQQYLLKFNIKSSIYNTANKENSIRILNITSKQNIKNFLDLIYNNAEMYIERKYDTYQKFCKIVNSSLSN